MLGYGKEFVYKIFLGRDLNANVYRRVVMPPMLDLPGHCEFVLPRQENRSCITINARILRSQSGVRATLAHDLINLGIGHGFVRRISTTAVEVLVVLPNTNRIDLDRITEYFGIKWNVLEEDYRVDHNNFEHINFLSIDLKVYRSTTTPNPEGRSLDADLDLLSVDGFSVISDKEEFVVL